MPPPRTAVIFGNQGALGRAVEAKLKSAGWVCWGVSPRSAQSPLQVSSAQDLPADLREVDAVVSCAGAFELNEQDGVDKLGKDQLTRMWLGNVNPAFDALCLAKQRKAKVLILSSALAAHEQQISHAIAYGACKSAVNSLAVSYQQANPHGTRVHCLLLTMMDTERNRSSMPQADHSKWLSPHTVAGKVLDLCSGGGGDVFVKF